MAIDTTYSRPILHVEWALQYVWNSITLEWDPMTQPGGGGGGPITIADGADATEGAIADAIVAAGAAGTISAKLRRATQGLEDLKSLIVLATGSNIIGRVGHDITGIGDGRKTVASAGTAEALAGSTPCKRVVITAETDNTGVITVGGATVVAALGTRRGVPLFPGDAIELEIDNLADVNIDTTVNGDGVTYTYFT
jgi:hypothetical protein